MSTPFRHAKHIDPALLYAPPRARQRDLAPTEPSAPAVNSDRGSAPLESGAGRVILRAQGRSALDPEWVPEPPQSQSDGRSYWKIALAGGILSVVAVIAWIAVSIPSVRVLLKSEVVRARFLGSSVTTDLAEQSTRTQLSNEQGHVSAKVAQETESPQEPRSQSDPSELPVSTSTAVGPPSMPVALTPVQPLAPKRTTPDFVTRQLDQEELASMRQRADDFIKSGDLSSARLLLERGAEAGDARATLTLAGTFDPNVLKTLGLQEGVADIAMARLWYDRAQRLDAAEAPRPIQEPATLAVQ